MAHSWSQLRRPKRRWDPTRGGTRAGSECDPNASAERRTFAPCESLCSSVRVAPRLRPLEERRDRSPQRMPGQVFDPAVGSPQRRDSLLIALAVSHEMERYQSVV